MRPGWLSVSAAFAVSANVLIHAQGQASAPGQSSLPYDTLFYSHDGLKLEAYLYQPEGSGPFPLIVYNHGSAASGEEAREWAAPYIARLFVPAGYALLVPERRGYGKSEGSAFSEDIGTDRGLRFVRRQTQESTDINAAVEHVLRTAGSSIDPRRIAIVGYSFGGIVTTLAAGSTTRYAAVILQAPGALNWNRSEDMRTALLKIASNIRVPILCTVAENDATTESARQLCARAESAGARATLKVYPAFTGGGERPGNPPGHALFGPRGVEIWKQDVLEFLSRELGRR